MNNISAYSDLQTANTNILCAQQRAFNLAVLSSKKVLEMCTGPSLHVLETEYAKYDIKCWGNDIDPRWKEYYPQGNWIIGNALQLNIDLNEFDTIVFAPPLSNNCSGQRQDSLSINNVTPSYYTFLQGIQDFTGIIVLVLPGRTLSLRSDKKQLYQLINFIGNKKIEIVPLKNKVVKYVDIYILP